MKMPMVARIDMVIKYTSVPFADQFEQALDVWDSAAAAVLHREDLLGRLVAVQKVRGNSNPIPKTYHSGLCQKSDLLCFYQLNTCSVKASSILIHLFSTHTGCTEWHMCIS